ncbi:GIY-YIG nuclease family protein [Sphingobium sp.]|uniref:GIY-YIG nuclease family protein n=1 Tax=Sphingobium sp. TaxID=1912891 RepID=UPI0028BD9DDD|nr:GIY-YIG nuclease family protein [Sphingobium sp.]
MSKPGYVYLMASGHNGTLYLGVTSNLVKRVWQHRNGFGSEFSAEYACRFLVWYEAHDDLQEARQREFRMKKWKRDWKLRLIEDHNPDWQDLFVSIAA